MVYYGVIRLTDKDTGEIVYETKKWQTSSQIYLYDKVTKNLASALRWMSSAANRKKNVEFSVLINPEQNEQSLFNDVF